MILILGASGFVGSHLFHYFKRKGYKVAGTFHHHGRKDLLYFDISSMNLKDLNIDLKKVKVIILATTAFHATVDDSKKYWKKAYYMNVVRLSKIIDECFQYNIFPIYLSSDYVFYGRKGNYKETDQKNPLTYYGKIKNTIDDYLLKSKKPFLMIRTGKIFGLKKNSTGRTLFQEMYDTLKRGKSLRCVDDQWITPVYIEDFCQWLELLMVHKQQGVFHLASLSKTTRYRIAKSIKKYFKLKQAKVIRCQTKDFKFLDKRPFRTDLDSSKFQNLFSIKQKKISDYLVRLL